MAGAMNSRTVQIHLNRRCNLSCRHCYSVSGPGEGEALDPGALALFLADAREQGYGVAAFSGGEPFLYSGFGEMLAEARHVGFACIGVTNGTVLSKARQRLLPLFDMLAVSVDGPEEIHNEIRRSPTAFSRLLAGLAVLRESGTRFGIAHTVTRASLPHLPWMADFAAKHGAQVLQLHPLGMVGAAASMEGAALDGEALARTYLTAMALRMEYGDELRIHVDLFNRERLRERPELVIPGLGLEPGEDLLSDALNPLVLMSNGDVSPVCHAMHPRFRLGNINDRRLRAMAGPWMEEGLPELRRFCTQLLRNTLAEENGWPYLNWYEQLEQASMRPHLVEAQA